jgi:hypothetical protein
MLSSPKPRKFIDYVYKYHPMNQFFGFWGFEFESLLTPRKRPTEIGLVVRERGQREREKEERDRKKRETEETRRLGERLFPEAREHRERTRVAIHRCVEEGTSETQERREAQTQSGVGLVCHTHDSDTLRRRIGAFTRAFWNSFQHSTVACRVCLNYSNQNCV